MNLLKKLKKNLLALFLLSVVFLPSLVAAQSTSTVTTDNGPLGRLKRVTSGGYAEVDETSLAATLGLIANVVLSLLGVIFIILIVIAGYQWMTAGGNEDQVEKAQARMKTAIIGLVITLAAWAIWLFVNTYFINSTPTGGAQLN